MSEPQHDLVIQATAMRRASRDRRWDVRDIVTEKSPGAGTDRPILTAALTRIRRREYDGLVVARLDRLIGSLAHFGQLYNDARESGWVLVALDIGVDLSTSAGQQRADELSRASEYERRLIGMRTAEALAAKRTAGIRLGRPRACPDRVLERVVWLHAHGAAHRQIADELNADGIRTPGGGARWYPSHVHRLLRTQDAKRLLRDLAPLSCGSP